LRMADDDQPQERSPRCAGAVTWVPTQGPPNPGRSIPNPDALNTRVTCDTIRAPFA
jgi:hypothetical protein